jgi:hypothetical protein
MTAERAHDNDTFPNQETTGTPVPELGNGTLIHLQQRAHERQKASKEHEMLLGFFEYTNQQFSLDIRQAQPSQSQELALATHAFLADVVARRIAALKHPKADADPAKSMTPPMYATPKYPIERNIRAYYKEFGYTRREKSELMRGKEEAFLDISKRPIYAKTYVGGDVDADGYEAPIKESFARAALFPELGLGIRLEQTLRQQGYETAADSAEVVLAAYGSWFPGRVISAAHQGIIRVRDDTDSHNIKHWQPEEIPEEFRAENYRPR